MLCWFKCPPGIKRAFIIEPGPAQNATTFSPQPRDRVANEVVQTTENSVERITEAENEGGGGPTDEVGRISEQSLRKPNAPKSENEGIATTAQVAIAEQPSPSECPSKEEVPAFSQPTSTASPVDDTSDGANRPPQTVSAHWTFLHPLCNWSSGVTWWHSRLYLELSLHYCG